ncbi:MAG: PAS domain S-box protein [Saonia sp.]
MEDVLKDEQLFQRMFEVSREGIVVVDDQGTVLKANPRGEIIFGYKKGELIQAKIKHLFPEGIGELFEVHSKENTERLKKRWAGKEKEMWGLKKNGAPIPLNINLSPTWIDDKPITIVFMAERSTSEKAGEDLKKVDKAPHMDSKKYNALIESLEGVVYRCKNDRDWTMEYIDKGCLHITGYDSKAFIDKETSLGKIILEADREYVWNTTQEALKEKRAFNIQYRIKDKEGAIKYIWEHGEGILDKDSKILAIEGFLQDMTEQMTLGEELRFNVAQNKALLKAIPDMMFVQDYKGNFIDLHAPEPERLPMQKQKIMGSNMKDIFPTHIYRLFKGAHKKTIKSKKLQMVEYVMERPYGRIYYESRMVPLNNHSILTIVRDITANKQAAFALEKEKEMLQKYLDTAASIFLVINAAHKIELINQKGCEVLGYPRNKIEGKNWFDNFIPKKDVKELSLLLDQVLSGTLDPPDFYENIVLTRGKRRKLIRWRNSVLKDDEGNAVAVLSSGVDITEQKKAERELRDSEAKTRTILEAIPDQIFVYDIKGNIVEIQASDTSLLIAPKENLIGKNVKEILPDNVSGQILETLEKVHRTKTMAILETTVPSMDRLVDFESRFVPFEKDKILAVARDITKTKAVQRVLNIRNRALEAAGNGILIVDAKLLDLPIIYSNDSFNRMTGYEGSEVLGKNCRFLQNDDRDQKEIQTIRKAIEERRPCRVVLRNYRKDGSMFWNEFTITPIRDDTGELTHFIGVQNDVTARKNEELRKDQIRKILELITRDRPLDHIGNQIVKAVEGHVEKCMASILLLNEEKGTLYKLVAPHLPKAFIAHLEEVKIGPNVGSCGTTAFLKKEVIVEDIIHDPQWENYKELALDNGLKACWSFPILSSAEEVLGTFAIYCDHVRKPRETEMEIITDMIQLTSVAIERYNAKIKLQKKREQLEEYTLNLEDKVKERTNEVMTTVQKLVETNLSLEDQIQVTKAAENRAMASQALFAAIAQNFPKGVIIVFNANMEFVYIEGEELNRIDLKKRDFKGKSIDSIPILSRKRKEKIKEDVQKTLAGNHLSFEIEYGKNSYSVNSTPLYADENVTWALFVYSNITQQKLVEQEIRYTLQREKELNELKSRFISMASHEFRTPLSAILSSAILIGKQNEPGKEEKREKYIRQIKTNVRNLVVILNDFLSLSKLEEGKVEFQPEHFDLVQLSKSLIEEIETSKKDNQTITLQHDVPVIEVFLDPKLMRHILINLVSNAIKYSDENKDIKVNISQKGETLSLMVADQGMGIPKAEQENLFGRFFRAKNAVNIQGTGLGLHIVKQYTELMGGTVRFKSEVGKGTTFYVELPLNRKKQYNEKNTNY